MARITVEDCIDKFPSRFELVLVASNRARKLHAGEKPTVEVDNDKNSVIALREIASETITTDQLKNDLVEEYQTNTFTEDEDINEEDINELEDNSDENRTEEKEEFVNLTDDSNNQVLEESNVEASKDNLENSSDEDKL